MGIRVKTPSKGNRSRSSARKQKEGKSQGNDQFHKAREVIAIHVRPEGNSAIAHFAEPVEFSVESEVLQNSKDGDGKSQSEQKPGERAPVSERLKSLHNHEE